MLYRITCRQHLTVIKRNYTQGLERTAGRGSKTTTTQEFSVTTQNPRTMNSN